MNYKTLESKKVENHKLRDKWFHYFEFILSGYDITRVENFENVIDILPNW